MASYSLHFRKYCTWYDNHEGYEHRYVFPTLKCRAEYRLTAKKEILHIRMHSLVILDYIAMQFTSVWIGTVKN